MRTSTTAHRFVFHSPSITTKPTKYHFLFLFLNAGWRGGGEGVSFGRRRATDESREWGQLRKGQLRFRSRNPLGPIFDVKNGPGQEPRSQKVREHLPNVALSPSEWFCCGKLCSFLLLFYSLWGANGHAPHLWAWDTRARNHDTP